MKAKINNAHLLLLLFLMVGMPAIVMAAAVSAECAYTNTTFACEVYVDTGADQLRSGGVLLTYNTSKLGSPVATKNDALWKFTDGATIYPYMNPETPIPAPGQPGQVVFIVGVLNTADLNAGVSGARVKVGSVSFTRNDPANPAPGTQGPAQATFFGISAALGKAAPSYPDFVNFVNTAGTPLDGGVTFSAKVARRGDANADGLVTNADMGVAKNLILSSGYLIYADADGNGTMTNADMGVIRNIILGQ